MYGWPGVAVGVVDGAWVLPAQAATKPTASTTARDFFRNVLLIALTKSTQAVVVNIRLFECNPVADSGIMPGDYTYLKGGLTNS